MEWHKSGACWGYGPDLWFGPETQTYAERNEREAAAKRICGTCTVRLTCLNHAIDEDIEHGIWGGLTPSERRRSENRRRVRSLQVIAVKPPPQEQPVERTEPITTDSGYTVLDTRVSWSGEPCRLLLAHSLETWHGAQYAVDQNGEIVFRAVDEADAWMFFQTVAMT